MNYAPYFRSLRHPDNHGEHDMLAYGLYSALFDGGLPELEAGAFLAAQELQRDSLAELRGLQQAMAERVNKLTLPRSHLKPIVIPTYHGTTTQPNLTALLALLLQRFEIPVLLHGTLEGHGGTATAYVLRELGIMPCVSPTQAQSALKQDRLCFVPTAVLSPGLAHILALRQRLGFGHQRYSATQLLDPFDGAAVLLVPAWDEVHRLQLQDFFFAADTTSLLSLATEGEVFANPLQRPAIEYFCEGGVTLLFEEEAAPMTPALRLPNSIDPGTTAQWIKQVLAGKGNLPHPIVNQLACCLFASGYTQDMHQAKAIAAVSTGSLAAA
jgi:anthranilate phosphoribosyltransferase